MTLILRQNVAGRPVAAPLPLDRRRRRLSTVVARHADRARPHVVSVHRAGEPPAVCDATVRLRKTWRHTLVGPNDTVIITYLPLGGSSRGGGGGKAIGGAIAMIALAIAAPYAIGVIGGLSAGLGSVLGTTAGLTLTGKLVAAGVVAGAGFLLSKATQAKANKEATDRPVYGVSGGGNVPRPGDRIPVGYGTFWTQPDLSQPDYSVYEGEDQYLYKRMTLGLGKYQIEEIMVGNSTLWTRGGGVQPPFNDSVVEIINPGGTSSIVPGAVVSADGVLGSELARVDENPNWSGPYAVSPVGVGVSKIQIDMSFPSGLSGQRSDGKAIPAPYSYRFEYAPADDDDNPTGDWQTLVTNTATGYSTKALRYTFFFDVPPGRYIVRGRNDYPDQSDLQVVNAISWDGLRGWVMDTTVRPHVTEVACRIKSGKSLATTNFSNIYVRASRILPVWNGAEWVEQVTRKAVHAFADVLRADYGGNLVDSQIDLARVIHYGSTLADRDTFDGVIRGPVSVFEAASTVLGVIRGEPVRIGRTWSIVRDEARAARKHLFTRRQIVRGSTEAEFPVAREDGLADVIVEYNPDADPRKRREVRVTFGAQSLTPNRVAMTGVGSWAHAHHLATWMAATAYFRRERRRLTVEHEGRLVMRGDPVLVDAWFMTNARAAGVLARNGWSITLDTAVTVGASTYADFRDRRNREWGPVKVTAGGDDRTIIVDSADAAAVAGFTGVSFASIFAADDEDMTSVVIGTLDELRDPFLIASVQPQSRDRVAIEALYDAEEVWTALGEAPPPEPPLPSDRDTDPGAPVVPWVRAQAVQRTTSLDMDWSVGQARGATSYVVDLSYDDWATLERVSEGLSTSGSYPIRNVEGQVVDVRAYAVSPEGVAGPPVFTTFTTFKPVLDIDTTDWMVDFENLKEELRHQIERISGIGADSIAHWRDDFEQRLQALAELQATTTGHEYAERQTIKLDLTAGDEKNAEAVDESMRRTFAAIDEERVARVAADQAMAQTTDTIAAGISNAVSGVIQEKLARVAADEALSQVTTALDSRLTDAETGISGQATAVNQLTTRVTSAEGQITATASQLTTLSATVGGHTSTLTQLGEVVSGPNGLSAQWGVVLNLDGATGGFVMSGVKQLGGSATFTFGIYGNLVVDGTISGNKLQAHSIITQSGQINNLTVNTLQIADNAVTVPVAASGSVVPPPGTSVDVVVTSIGFTGIAGKTIMINATFIGTVGASAEVVNFWQCHLYINDVQVGALSGATYDSVCAVQGSLAWVCSGGWDVVPLKVVFTTGGVTRSLSGNLVATTGKR
ncbi:host specificity factor TipJ family phage tail protein [Chelatococcus sp.]|uniref:host specificity factor TipJ family phage tail protein n=1 Tax=Chelatococcus sp. TaxID=1953771 RepID=UPI001EBF09EF|nr:host specificity factor TipJ family phage tail protein [Chelatococcus sp.]MBX3543572.1 hypothetical protein [Chelatococcus sp.]